MNDETKVNMEQKIKSILEQFVTPLKVTTTSTPLIPIDKVIGDIMDEFIEVMCGNCEYSCNESNCDKRHNE